TDYISVANLASAYPFTLTGNATSTLTQFNGGITAFASSTIGGGTQSNGLTINGAATTSLSNSGSVSDQLFLANLANATSTGSRINFRTLDTSNNATTTASIHALLSQNFNTAKGTVVFST